MLKLGYSAPQQKHEEQWSVYSTETRSDPRIDPSTDHSSDAKSDGGPIRMDQHTNEYFKRYAIYWALQGPRTPGWVNDHLEFYYVVKCVLISEYFSGKMSWTQGISLAKCPDLDILLVAFGTFQ